jgi:hypothetical protein
MDPKDATPSRSFLTEGGQNFLLGQLVDRTQTLSEEQKLNREAVEALPEKISARINPRFEKLESRVTALEQWRWYIIGAGAAIGGGITLYEVLLK